MRFLRTEVYQNINPTQYERATPGDEKRCDGASPASDARSRCLLTHGVPLLPVASPFHQRLVRSLLSPCWVTKTRSSVSVHTRARNVSGDLARYLSAASRKQGGGAQESSSRFDRALTWTAEGCQQECCQRQQNSLPLSASPREGPGGVLLSVK